MPIITQTYVKSLNGYTGSPPFVGDGGVVIDGNDIRMTGSSGTKVTEKAQSIAQNIRMLEMIQIEQTSDYRMRIGNYQL